MLAVSIFSFILVLSVCACLCLILVVRRPRGKVEGPDIDKNLSQEAMDRICSARKPIHTPASSKEEALLTKIRTLSSALVNALRKENDPIARTVSSKYLNSYLINEADGPTGSASHNGCVHYNVRSVDNMYDDGRLRALICHELAHAWGKGHDAEWLRANAYLLRVSSEKLGWNNNIRCKACDKYGLCDKAMCPECIWEDIKRGETRCS